MTTLATNRQVPDHAILDHFDKQTYLGNQYVYTSAATVGASETAYLTLSNPVVSGSAFPAKNVGLFCNVRRVGCLTASQSVIYRVYLNPTVTVAGTPVTPVNLRPASTNVPVGVVATSPTVSSNGTLLDVIVAGSLSTSLSNLLLVLDAGQSLLVTAQASAASTSLVSELGWFEQ